MPRIAAPRFSVTFPAAMSQEPLTGRLLLVVVAGSARANRAPGHLGRRRDPVLRDGRRGLEAGQAQGTSTPRCDGFPLRSLDDLPTGEYSRAGGAQPLREVHAQRRPHAAAAARPGRRPGLAPEARQPLFEAHDGPHRPRTSRPHRPRARPGDSAGRGIREQADEVRALLPHPQRAAVEILGSRHVPRSLGAAALGIRRASGGPLSARDRARAFPGRARRLPRNAAGPGSQAGLQQALPARGLQPHPAGVRLAGPPGLDHARLPARAAGRDPAPDAVSTTIRTR